VKDLTVVVLNVVGGIVIGVWRKAGEVQNEVRVVEVVF